MKTLKTIILISAVMAALFAIMAVGALLAENTMGEFYKFDDRGDYAWDYAYFAQIFGICWIEGFCVCLFIGAGALLIGQGLPMLGRSVTQSPRGIRILITAAGALTTLTILCFLVHNLLAAR